MLCESCLLEATPTSWPDQFKFARGQLLDALMTVFAF